MGNDQGVNLNKEWAARGLRATIPAPDHTANPEQHEESGGESRLDLAAAEIWLLFGSTSSVLF